MFRVQTCSGGQLSMAAIIAFPREDQRRYTVLIVDDEPAIRGFLYDYLSEAGFNPLTAESGDAAITMRWLVSRRATRPLEL